MLVLAATALHRFSNSSPVIGDRACERIYRPSEGLSCRCAVHMSASESADLSDQEEASGSSDDESMQGAASGSDEQDEESDDEESEDEVLEPKVLPARGTRGNRMNALVAEEDSADEEFWQQEFFAEENRDQEYEKSSEGEDEADTDFSESVAPTHLL